MIEVRWFRWLKWFRWLSWDDLNAILNHPSPAGWWDYYVISVWPRGWGGGVGGWGRGGKQNGTSYFVSFAKLFVLWILPAGSSASGQSSFAEHPLWSNASREHGSKESVFHLSSGAMWKNTNEQQVSMPNMLHTTGEVNNVEELEQTGNMAIYQAEPSILTT